jgi:hypothetical protein
VPETFHYREYFYIPIYSIIGTQLQDFLCGASESAADMLISSLGWYVKAIIVFFWVLPVINGNNLFDPFTCKESTLGSMVYLFASCSTGAVWGALMHCCHQKSQLKHISCVFSRLIIICAVNLKMYTLDIYHVPEDY